MSSADPREPEEPPIRFTDNRKLKRDAAAAAADEATSSAAPAGEPAAEPDTTPEPDASASLLDERTADLQRLQAEYANYRKRAERDRLQAGDAAVARVLADLLPVIDDLERAKAHDDLTGPLKAVADKLEGVTAKLGLTAFGAVGDPFDPSRHEAVLHDESSDVTVPTCTTVMRPGYTAHDRLLRPAMVGVSDPAGAPPSPDEAHHNGPDENPSATTGNLSTAQGNQSTAQGNQSTAEQDPAGAPPTPPNEKPEGNQPPVS